MGLFGSIFHGIGKAIGGIGKVAGFALRSGLAPIPFGGTAGRLLGGLLHAKAPMGHTALKLSIPPLVLRGKTLRPSVTIGGTSRPTITALRKSPVMPGGSVSTPRGIAPRPLGAGAGRLSVTGSAKPKRKRRRHASSSSRSSSGSSGRRTRKRGHHSRRLKFGSPAWRKKYLGHGRKRRKRRAA